MLIGVAVLAFGLAGAANGKAAAYTYDAEASLREVSPLAVAEGGAHMAGTAQFTGPRAESAWPAVEAHGACTIQRASVAATTAAEFTYDVFEIARADVRHVDVDVAWVGRGHLEAFRKGSASPFVTAYGTSRTRLRAGVATNTAGGALEPSPWPPRNGAIPGTERATYLEPGTRIDRYGRPDAGGFVSPEGVPYENRALRPGTEGYTVYVVNKPLPVTESRATPGSTSPMVDLNTSFRWISQFCLSGTSSR